MELQIHTHTLQYLDVDVRHGYEEVQCNSNLRSAVGLAMGILELRLLLGH